MKLKDAKYFGIKLSPHRIKNDKGQLIVTGCEFARTGKQKYHSSELGIEDKDEFIYLDRPVEEVSDPKTVASFEGAPVTLDHPEDDVKVGVNYNELAKGFAKDVKYVAINDKEGYLQADFVITDADLIKKIENNEINELSAGYNCDVDENDWVQRHIRGNHIAVVEQARAGHQARLLDKKYKSTSKSLKTLKIGDSVVKIVDSYSYELENLDGTKTKYTDYYTEGPTGKKKYVTTLKDEVNPKNAILVKIDGKWKTWGGTNRDKFEEDSRYEALVKKYGKENLKFVPNKDLDKAKEVKDSKESDAKVLKALENLLPEFKKLDEKYAGLVAMQKKYWNNWDGYSRAVHSGELSKAKLEKMQAQSVKANKEYLELVKKWNKLCEQTTRREGFPHYIKGVASEIKGNEEIHFPEDHYYGDTSVEKFSYMLNEINKVLADYPKGTGDKDWRAKSKDSKVNDAKFKGSKTYMSDPSDDCPYLMGNLEPFKSKNILNRNINRSDLSEDELWATGWTAVVSNKKDAPFKSFEDIKFDIYDNEKGNYYDYSSCIDSVDKSLRNKFLKAINDYFSKKSVKDSSKFMGVEPYYLDEDTLIIRIGKYINREYRTLEVEMWLDEGNSFHYNVYNDYDAWNATDKEIKDFGVDKSEIEKFMLDYDNKDIKDNKLKVKDSDEEIFARRQEIDDNLQEVFDEKFFDIEGFVNGNESTEGSIYVVYYNPYDDSEAVEYAEDNLDEDYDDEEFLDCASEFIEDKIERILRDKYNMMGENGSIDSIDVAPIDWSGEEEYPINFHIYCNGVTK